VRVNRRRRRVGRLIAWTLLLFPLLAGCAGRRAEVRGRPPSGPVTAVARLAAMPARGTATVRGTMVEK
jgi:hypothetical protein